MQEWALVYARRNWRVHPCHTTLTGVCSCKDGAECERSPGKHPMLGGWQDQATDTAGQVDAWWQRAPDANIGIATGAESGIVVVDIDDLDAIPTLEARGPLPDTLTAFTGGGGVHLFYASTDPLIRNSAGLRGWLAVDGVDIRANGGFVLAAPSFHESGKRYEWEEYQRELAPLPGWIVEAYAAAQRTLQPAAAGLPSDMPAAAGTTRWGATVLERECARLMAAAPGSRNHVLYHCALKVAGAVKAGELDGSQARSQLTQVAQRIGLTEQETAGTVDSAWAVANERRPQERPDRIVGSGVPSEPYAPLAVQQPAQVRSQDRPVRPAVGGMLSLDDLDELPPVDWLIPGMLPKGLNQLFGQYGCGKTFTAIDWSLSLACGVIDGTARNVVYALGEGVEGFNVRLKAWLAHTGLPAPRGRFYVRAGKAFTRLLDPQSVAELCSDIEQMDTPPDLLVVDTLARSMGGGEEGAKEFGTVIRVCDDLRNRYGTSTLLLHHAGVNPDRERGHTSLGGACDSVWKLEAPEYQDTGYHKLENTKQKDGQRHRTVELKMNQMHGSVVLMPATPDRMRRSM